ncbi:DUF4190 domain-containing protein [Streptomyces sp. NPDC001407]|uniref:DUF4190 domain-containing protein n=1 Tax=Streptomyces sp. NPDC001407 TaxID=3364573 RepID=UPI00368C56CF
MSDKGSETGSDKGAMADGRPESRDRDPWAPPEPRAQLDGPGEQQLPQQRVPLDKPGARTAPPHGAVPPGAPQGPPPHVFPPAAPTASAVPPVPQAPTGPGTPSAYPAGPYGQQPYGQMPYGQPPYGHAAPYGQPPYGYAPPGSYGYPTAPYGPGWQQPVPSAGNGLGVAALVLGIIGTVLSPTVFLGVILGILAIIFGGIGRSKVSNGEADNGGQSLAGLILGGVGLLASVLMLIFYINVGHSSHKDPAPEDDPGATYGAYLSAAVRIVDRAPAPY